MASAPEPPRELRRDRASAAGIALVTGAAIAAPLPWLDAPVAAAVFFDDAFYYFQIARHVAAGAGFTFDGIHPTSGFHPLWLFVLVPVFAVVPGDLAPLRAVLAIEALLVGAAASTVFAALRPRLGRAPAAAAALLLLAQPGAARILRGGMEAALVVCLFAAAWASWLAVRDDPQARPARWLRLGAWCALLFLARLETGIAVLVLAGLGWQRFGADRRRLIALVAPLAACAAAYVAWTWLCFGTLGPVSALVKAEFGSRSLAALSPLQRAAFVFYIPWPGDWAVRRTAAALGVDAAVVPALASVLLLALLVAVFLRRHAVGCAVARGGAAFVLLTAAGVVIADKIALALMLDWYRAPMLLAAAVAGGLLAAWTARAGRVMATVFAAAAVAATPIAIWHAAHPPPAPGLAAAEWLKANARPGEAASWNAGLIGYFAGGGVVNLDGLVNDARFAREVARGKALSEYLRREEIRWLADATREDGRLMALLRRYPAAEVRAVEARYRPLAAYTGACPPGLACVVVAIWEAVELPPSHAAR
jgi:hypothetical protein